MVFQVSKILLTILLSWEYSCRFSVSADIDPNDTKLILYYGPDYSDSMVYNLSDAADILNNENFIYEKTHLYFHGYTEAQDHESVHVIVDAYLKRKTVNIITVDWAKAASGDLQTVALSNIEMLAPFLADAILSLYNAGIEKENFEVVAHSLGAQLAALTGRDMMNKTNGEKKFYRMAALDAAFSLVFQPFLTLDKNDAEFLQAIHTDSGHAGTPLEIGHVDFWPNGGRAQPGCPQENVDSSSTEDVCSHHRSWQLWAESVANPNGTKFLGFPASSYVQFLLDGEENLEKEIVEMGIDCPMDARGNYYLLTNSESPYALGMDGYKFPESDLVNKLKVLLPVLQVNSRF